MTKLARVDDLKCKLDEIDKQVFNKAINGFYESRLIILLGMWNKGKAISDFTGGKIGKINFLELERETGRDADQLKKWLKTYNANPHYDEYLKIAEKKAHEWTVKALEEKNKSVLATLHTGDHESYTPEQYIESARTVMGSIDLDPASNDHANITVKSSMFYNAEDDGLSKDWKGNVWLNPPYEYPLVEKFINKLIVEFNAGRVFQAILLTNNNTDTQWFYNAALNAQCICFTKGRINFNKIDGSISQPTNGQAFYYFGDNQDAFNIEFCKYGLLMTVING